MSEKQINPDDYLDRLQADAHELLRGVPSLATACHLVDDEGDIEAAVKRKLATINSDTGTRGLAVIVLMPVVNDAAENLPGPYLTVTQEVQVIEQVLFNRGGDGTRIRSATAALRVLAALHMQTVGPCTWKAAKKPVRPLPVVAGHVSHAVTFEIFLKLPPPLKAAGVNVTLEGADLTLTCPTAGAAIHYTTDGSLPRPGAATTHLYSAPIDGSDLGGTTIRASAWIPDGNPGDVLQFTILD